MIHCKIIVDLKSAIKECGIVSPEQLPPADDIKKIQRSNPQGVLQMAQNFHNFISRKLNANQVKFKFKKPLNTASAGNVKAYKVLRGTTNVFSAATELATTTKTSFIDENTTDSVQTWTYFVVPVNTAGDGVATDGVTLTVPTI